MKQWWRFFLQSLEHGFLLPWMARLPLEWAYALARYRGRFNARFARDWMELTLGFAHVGERCRQAFGEMFPTATEEEISQLVRERYETVAIEEMEGWLAIRGRLDEVEMDLEPVREAMKKRKPGRGLVIVMSHLDNLFFGIVGIARCGFAVHLMTSAVVEDPRIHPRMREFFLRKYKAYDGAMAGGALLPTSSESKDRFYSVLRQGGIVVVVSETPASNNSDKGTWVQWLGKRRKLTDGALRMAIDTDSELVAMQNLRSAKNLVEWKWSEMLDPRDFQDAFTKEAREAMFSPLCGFLERGVLAHPGRWWGSHLLSSYQVDEQK